MSQQIKEGNIHILFEKLHIHITPQHHAIQSYIIYERENAIRRGRMTHN